MTISTAVTSVAKTANPTVAAPAAAPKGRPVIVLKNGRPYTEARDEAKANVANAKLGVKTAADVHKTAVAEAASIEKNYQAALKLLAKENEARAKANGKAIDAAVKGRAAAQAALEKAEAAVAAVEAQKAALTAKPN